MSLKPKKCKDCKETFQPFKTMQPRCIECAIEKGKASNAAQAKRKKKDDEKQFNAETRRRKAALKSKGSYKKEAQAAFNAFIRERDLAEPCISCGKFTHDRYGGGYDAGHYKSRGSAPELAFEELNCHKQCKKCNNQLSGNIVNYRLRLLVKIGEDKLNWLEGPHELTRYSIDDYQAIKKKYRAKLRELQKCTTQYT